MEDLQGHILLIHGMHGMTCKYANAGTYVMLCMLHVCVCGMLLFAVGFWCMLCCLAVCVFMGGGSENERFPQALFGASQTNSKHMCVSCVALVLHFLKQSLVLPRTSQ